MLSLVHLMYSGGSPLALHCKFTSSPSSTSIVPFDRVVIFGGTKKSLVTTNNYYQFFKSTNELNSFSTPTENA